MTRPWGISRRVWLAGLVATSAATALGRPPHGGKLALKIPWPLRSLDPHAIEDPVGALFGPAVADPLFALDHRGRPYPSLAAGLPEQTPRGARVQLRPYLRTAKGRPLDARDLLYSWKRARANAAAGLLTAFEEPFHDRSDGLAMIVPGADPTSVATALANPATALLPRGYRSQQPDATGSFVARFERGSLILERNPSAARGASYLWTIEVEPAQDLADALRAFEAGEVDVGWLGSGLHRPRPNAVQFSGPSFGWAVLRTGKQAKSWGAPGVAQRLLDGIPAARLTHLGLHGMRESGGSPRWGGARADLLFAEDAPHLAEIARALAALMTAPGHEVVATARPSGQITSLRSNGQFTLMVDFVRRIGPSYHEAMLSLLTAAKPELAGRPPQRVTADVRQLGQILPVGVIGELTINGAHVPGVAGLEHWNLGAVYRQA